MAKKKMPAVESNPSEPPPVKPKGSKTKFVLMVLFALAGVAVAARLVVWSGVNIATLLGAPPILLGAKVIAIGTSLPELTTDFTAVRRGRVHLALGGIIGSNLTNLNLVLGLVLLFSPFAVDTTIFSEILPFLLITTVIFWRFLAKGGISKIGGVVLLVTYLLFQIFVV